MQHKKVLAICLVLLLFSSALTFCVGPPSHLQEEVPGTFVPEGQFFVQTGNLLMYGLDVEGYGDAETYYRFESGGQVLAEGIEKGSSPTFSRVGDGVYQMVLLYGMGFSKIQYFDIDNHRASETFPIYGSYTDYYDWQTGEYLLARFKFIGADALVITDIFGDTEFYVEIDRGFYSTGCQRIVFLNENEIYIDCLVFADGYSRDDAVAGRPFELEQIREIITFR